MAWPGSSTDASIGAGSGGTVTVSGTLAAKTVNLTSGTLLVGDGGNLTTSLTTASGAAVKVTNNGQLTLSGATASSTINVDSGGLLVGTSYLTGSTFNFNGGTFRNSSTRFVTGTTTINLSSGGLTIDTGSQVNNFVNSGTATISGGGGITKIGAGSLTMANVTSSYTGVTEFKEGTVVALASQLGTGFYTFTGGTLQQGSSTDDISSRGTFKNSTSAIVYNANSRSITWAGSIDNSNTGGLTVSNGAAYTVTLSGTNAYKGWTTVNGGTLKMGGANALPSATAGSGLMVKSSSTFDANTYDMPALQALSGGGTVKTKTSGAVTFASSGGAASLTVGDSSLAAGTLTIATGGLTLNSNTTSYFDLFAGGSLASADKVSVTTALAYAGTLNIANKSGGALTQGSTWDLFDFASKSGTFSSITSDVAGATFTMDYTSGILTLASLAASGNNSKLYFGATPPADGASANSTSFGRVMLNSTQQANVSLNKSGTDATTYSVTAAGNATSSSATTGIAYSGTPSINAALNTTATGLRSGTVTVDNLAADSAAAGQGSADGNDVVTVSGTVVANRIVTASTVHLGRQILGANLGSVGGSTTLSTTGDNDHYTAVTVKGHQFNSAGSTLDTTATGTVASLAASGTLTTLTTTGEGLAGEAPINVAVGYDATALTKRTIAQSGTVNAGRLMSGSTKSFSGTATLSAGGGDSNTSTTLSVAGVTGAVDHAGLYSASVTGTLTGASGSLNSLSVTGEGLTGEGTYGNVAINYTADVFNPIELVASSSYNAFASGDNKVVVSGSKGNYVFTTATAATAGGTNQAFVNVQTPGDFTKPEYVLLALTGVSGLTNQTLAIDVASAINNSGLSGVHATYEGQDAATNKMLADWSGYSAYKGTDIGDFDVLVKFDSYSAANGVLAFDFSQIDGGAASVSAIGVVPEPTSLGLMALPALGLLARRRRAMKKA